MSNKSIDPLGPLSNTSRGFERIDFRDANGEECSLQVSSAVREEALVWFGINDPAVMVNGYDPEFPGRMRALTPVEMSELHYETFGRMHLTQSQVRALLPRLQAFAELGTLEVAR